MITIENYKDTVKGINFSQLPVTFWKGHDFVQKSSENYSNWDAYHKNETIKRVMDAYFAKLDEHLQKHPIKGKTTIALVEHSEPERKAETKTPVQRKTPIHKAVQPESHDDDMDYSFVERIPEEIRFMKRYISMNGKKKTKEDLLRFINALHRAIIEKKVRKSSPYSKQIEYMQDKLVKTYNAMTKALTVEIGEKTILEFKSLIMQEKVMPSVNLIKRYINLNGKYNVKDKAKLLMDAMQRASKLKKVTKTDKYAKLLDTMFANLNAYVKNKSQKILSIQQTELNGLNGVLGCACEVNGLEGIEEVNAIEETANPVNEIPGVMSSMDFRNVQFKTLGFVGKYRKLIGDPSKGFSVMVYGKPKMGKSFLCVDFAGYLARNHGNVLYVAKEEGLDMTLQDKLKAKDVAHPNLFVAEEIPSDLTPYDFIFFDSVNKLGLSTGDLETLRSNYPSKSFIYIFQTTKEGNFRGANEFQHDVDVVIQVPEKGLAVQNGRFNQGGEMRIFEELEYREAA
ncbi:MAG: hypothetical protein HY062_02495 [Bacteroidetes bacterium]|nr:hypothetical protein [Bacteroidota bacterium]